MIRGIKKTVGIKVVVLVLRNTKPDVICTSVSIDRYDFKLLDSRQDFLVDSDPFLPILLLPLIK